MSSHLSPAQIVFLFYIPMLLADMIIFSKLLFQLQCSSSKGRNQISTVQRRVHIICFCCILLTSVCDMAHSFAAIITDSSLVPELDWIVGIEIAADFFYFLSSLLIYLLLIDRLYSTFQHTIYQLTQSTLTMLFVMIGIQCLFMTAYCIDQWIDSHTDSSIWYRVSGGISACVLIFDILLNLFFFALFIRKLRQSVLMRLRLECSDSRSRNIEDSLKQSSNTKMLDVITKQTIIGTSVSFCSVGLLGFLLPASIVEAFYKDTEISIMFAYIARAAEGVLISYLLYLGLSMNDAAYRKACGRCHRNCYNYTQSTFKKEITKDYYLRDDLDASH